MHIIYTAILGLLLSGVAIAQNEPVTRANYDLAARFSPDKLENMVFSTRVDPHWLKNTNRFWYEYETSEGKFYYIVNPARKSKTPLFNRDELAAEMTRLSKDPFDGKHLDLENLTFINNETAIRFEVESKLVEEEDDEEEGKKKMKTWYFVYTLNSGNLRLLEDYEKPKDDADWASVAPDSSYVLFARNYNLYWMDYENYLKALEDEEDSTIVENQWTDDGVEYYSYAAAERGKTNREKEEEKNDRKAVDVVWSPDSRKFIMTRNDAREVDDLYVINSVADPRPTLETYKYQMPGEEEAPQADLLLFEFNGKSQQQIEDDRFPDQSLRLLDEPQDKNTRDDKRRPDIWLGENARYFYFARISRDYKRVDMCQVDANTGEVNVLVEERLNTYIDRNTHNHFRVLDNGRQFIHWSERTGWGHLYLYNQNGVVRQLTSGPWHVDGVEGVNEQNSLVYFRANGREEGEDPYFYHMYRVGLNGGTPQLLNRGNFHHASNINDNQTYFVDNYSRVNTTPQSDLYDNRGDKIMSLETTDLSQLFAAGYQFPEPFVAKAGDGITDIYGVMYKPFNFDSTKLYPIIEYVYPGPQTEAVSKSFSARMNRTDRMAQLGFVVITLGNRGGHPDRSKWYHNYGYGNLRDYGLKDKKIVAEQLAMKHDFIDINKVGIFGHSGGGFMSTAAMLVYPEFFKVAVSSSGNHDNAVYNRWWSETHHGVKEVTDSTGKLTFEYDIDKNPDLASNLKGKLMITTGDIDNNVHPAGTIRMANALIKANKRFDFFIFPGQRHGYGDMYEYFFWLKADYFSRHLMGDPNPRTTDVEHMNRDEPADK
jgi:dipeptidyl-peptidase 4